MPNKTKLLSDTIIYTLGNVLTQIVNFVLLPVFSRYLSPADFGIFYYTNTIQAFVFVFSTLSLNSFILRRYFELNDEQSKKKLFGTIFIFLFAVNVLLLSLQLLLFPYLIHIFKLQIPFYPYFLLTVVNTFLEFFCIFPQIYYRIGRKPVAFLIFTSAKTILTVGLSLFLVIYLKWGLLGRFYGITILDISFAILSVIIIYRISILRFDLEILKKGLKFSLPLLPGTIAYIALGSVDRIVLERYYPISELGVYSISAAIGSVLGVITLGYYRAIEPEIYRTFAQNDFKQKMGMFQQTFLLLTVPIGCMIILFSKEMLILLFSKAFFLSYSLIPFFVVAVLFKGLQSMAGVTLFALNKTKYDLFISCIGIGINIILCLILIPKYGKIGAAVATMMTSWSIYIVYVFIVQKLSSLRWRSLYTTLIVGIPIGISWIIMQLAIMENVWFSISVKMIIVCIAFGVIVIYAKKHASFDLISKILNPSGKTS